MELKHEFDERSNHRISSPNRSGEWASYRSPATFVLSGGRVVIAVTEYYDGSKDFPNPGKLYEVKEWNGEG